MESISIGWPQAIYLGLVFMSFGYVVANDGKPRGNYSSVGSMCGMSAALALLWWGGFFTN